MAKYRNVLFLFTLGIVCLTISAIVADDQTVEQYYDQFKAGSDIPANGYTLDLNFTKDTGFVPFFGVELDIKHFIMLCDISTSMNDPSYKEKTPASSKTYSTADAPTSWSGWGWPKTATDADGNQWRKYSDGSYQIKIGGTWRDIPPNRTITTSATYYKRWELAQLEFKNTIGALSDLQDHYFGIAKFGTDSGAVGTWFDNGSGKILNQATEENKSLANTWVDNNVTVGGTVQYTNLYAGLTNAIGYADPTLKDEKTVVLLSDGAPTKGDYYTSTNPNYNANMAFESKDYATPILAKINTDGDPIYKYQVIAVWVGDNNQYCKEFLAKLCNCKTLPNGSTNPDYNPDRPAGQFIDPSTPGPNGGPSVTE